MKITDYIVLGGENLNDPSQKTPDFTAEAEQVFKTNCFSLGSSDHNLESWLELPVNDSFRLFIRMFWMERRGQRALCYYIGLQLPKRLYFEARDFYRLNKGISLLTLETILSALDNASPIEVPLVPQPQSAIGSSFEELCKLKLFGTEKFSENMEKMRLSISINSIDDWFNRLRIAVNPSRPPKGCCLLVAKQVCDIPTSNPLEATISSQATFSEEKNFSPQNKTKKGTLILSAIFLWIITFLLGVLVGGIPTILYLGKEKAQIIEEKENSEAKYHSLDIKYCSLEEENRKNLANIEELRNSSISMQQTLQSFQNKYAKQQEEISRLRIENERLEREKENKNSHKKRSLQHSSKLK